MSDRAAAEATGPESVSVRDLTFRYPSGGYELEVPSFGVGERERVALIGPSGAGKTTLLYLIAGILQAQRGRLSVLGEPLEQLTEAQRRAFRLSRVGMIFQEFELLDHLTVSENILLPHLCGANEAQTADVQERMHRLCARAGLERHLERRPRALSQGERQRVAICRALITAPTLLLADEPTGNLDPTTTLRILDAVFEEAEEHRASLVWITHDHSILDRFDRTVDFLAAFGGQA